VTLDQNGTYPVWLPETYVRLDYTRFADDLVGAIKLRVVELGGEIRIETALGKAQRMEAVAQAEAERTLKLTREGRAAVRAEWDELHRLIARKIAEIKPHVEIQNGWDEQSHVIRTTLASIRLSHYPVPVAAESQIAVQDFVGQLLLPEERGKRMHIPGEEPKRISDRTIYFDYGAALGWCWRSDKQLLTTDSLAESILKQILEIHGQVESDTVPHRGLRERLNR
jgi:hypothetical protein